MGKRLHLLRLQRRNQLNLRKGPDQRADSAGYDSRPGLHCGNQWDHARPSVYRDHEPERPIIPDVHPQRLHRSDARKQQSAWPSGSLPSAKSRRCAR